MSAVGAGAVRHAIEARALFRTYSGVPAVSGVELGVVPGEIFGLLGRNGAGKTTLLRMLAGVLRPTAGEVWIAGVSMAADPVEARRHLGYLDEEPLLYEHLTGWEFLELVADLYGVDAPRRMALMGPLLQTLGLAEKQDEMISGYSHGMRGKIGLASVLVHEPEVLLLDEPTNGLDPPSARRVKDLLTEYAARGAAVVLSTHILEVAQALCSRVGIIDRGRMVALGTVEELRERVGDRDATLEALFLDLVGDRESQELVAALRPA